MSDRRVKVIFEAEISKFKQGMADASKETEKLAKTTETAGKSVDERMQKINAVAAADQRAAKAAGLLYNAQGQLSDSNGKVLSSTQAAAHGVDAFSEAVYLAGQESEEAAAKSAAAAEKQKKAWETVAPVMMAAGAGIVAGVGIAVKKYADFDKAMSGVQAATHESTANMALMREEAIRAGADTAFSASEAAQGIEELAKAGVTTAEIMGGGLTGALDLAAAGELGVGDAAEIASSAMTQFKLGGDQVVHLADLLAAGAGKAQGGVQDLGAALGQAGLVASSTGLSIEETIGGLTAFASAGLMGSDAGTSFKSMLQRLTPQSKEAQRTFDELGISAYDANGEFIGLAEFAGVLKTQMADLTPEARNAAMGVMFGSDAVRASTILYEQGAEGIKDWIGQVDDAGYAAKTASIMQNNLAGDLEKLGGAFDTVFIQSGGVGNDMLRGLVQSAESVVDAFGKIPAPVLGVGTVLAGVAGGGLLLGGALITTIPKIKDTVDALRDVIPAGGKADKSLRGVGKAAAYATGGLAALSVVGPGIASLMNSGATADGTQMANALRDIGTGGTAASLGLDQMNKMFTASDKFWGLDSSGVEDAFRIIGNPNVADNVDNIVSSFFSLGTKGSANIEFAKKNFAELDSQLSSMVSNGMTDQAATAYESLAQKAVDAGVPIEKLVEIFPGYNSALAQNSTAAAAAVGANEETASALDEVGLAANGAVEDMEKFLDALFSVGNVNMSVRDAAIGYQESLEGITEAQKEIAKGKLGKTLNKAKDDFDITTKAGKLANSEFQGLAKSGMAEVEAMAEKGLGQDELQAKLNTTYKDLLKAADGFGLGKKEAEALTREVLGVPEGVDIKTWIDNAAQTGAEEITAAVSAIPEMKNVKVIVTEDGTVQVTDAQIQSIKDRTIATTVTDEGTILQVQGGINNVKGKTEHILVNDDGTVQVVQAQINKTTGKTEYIRVTDDGTVAGVQNKIDNLHGTSVTIQINESRRISQEIVEYGNGRKASGGRIPKRSTGGRLPYTGLGTDKILGINSDGVPVSWVDDGEWVIRESMSTKHNALLSMINRDDPRLGMLKQLMGIGGLAKGGRVGAAEKKVKSTKRAYDLIDGKKANRLRKLAAKDQWEAAKAELAAVKKSSKASADAAKKAEAARKKAAEEEKARQGRLSDARVDLRTDLRRGNITDAFTSGSGLGQIDKLLDASRNKDYSKSQRRGLARDAGALEKALSALTGKSEKLKEALEAAKDQAEELRSVRDAVSGGLRGEFALSGSMNSIVGPYKTLNAKGIISTAKGAANRIAGFGKKLDKLRGKGYSAAIVEEVAGLGSAEGGRVADALLSGSKSEVSELNKQYRRLDYWSGQAGESVTKSMYKGGIDAAQGLVNGLQGKTKDVESAFYKLGKDAEKSFKRSLGIKSPSRNAMGWMSDVVDGSVIGVDQNTSKLESAMFGLGKAGEQAFQMQPAFSVPPSPEVARYAAQPASGAVVDTAAIAAAVAGAISSYQPVVNIGGRKFYGSMQDANRQYGSRH